MKITRTGPPPATYNSTTLNITLETQEDYNAMIAIAQGNVSDIGDMATYNAAQTIIQGLLTTLGSPIAMAASRQQRNPHA